MRLIDMSVAAYPPRFAAHRALYLTGMALGLTLLLAAHTQAATVSLAWDAVASSGGYKLYYGTQSRSYTTIIDVGPVTNRTVTIADPASPQTYYFAVTAYDSSRSIESGFSNEVSKLLQPTPPPSPPTGSTITLEAEDMTLTGYTEESTTAASGGVLISRLGVQSAAPGVARQVFLGPAGTYTITVWYFDENDGRSTLTMKVNGIVVETWIADADLAANVASTVSRTSRTVDTAFSLAPGDIIELVGSEQGGEYARFDKIVFVPVSSGPVAIAGRVAAYAFDATSGTTASEASGNGTNGVLTNGAVFAAGKYGNGVDLDGVNDYVNLGNPASLRLTGSMTLSAWINSSDFPFDDAAIISKRQSSHVGYQLDTTIDRGPRTIGFKISDASGNSVARYGATTLVVNTWYHVAGVYDATNRTMNVYLNGQLNNGALVGTIPAAQPDSNQNVNIGQRPGLPGTFNFEGMLDDVRIYNRALSALEIQADMNMRP